MNADKLITTAAELVAESVNNARFAWAQFWLKDKGALTGDVAATGTLIVFNLPPDKRNVPHVLEVSVEEPLDAKVICDNSESAVFNTQENAGVWCECWPMCPYFPVSLEYAVNLLAEKGFVLTSEKVKLCHEMSRPIAEPHWYFETNCGLVGVGLYTASVEEAKLSYDYKK